MVLVRSDPLEVAKEGFFGRKFRTRNTYDCEHGEHATVIESGWMCYGMRATCECCGVNYCYVDPDENEIIWRTDKICSFCYGK